MKKSMFVLASLLVAGSISAQQQEGTIMKKFETQLPAPGRGNATVMYQGRSIDQMVYEFMEKEGIPGLTLAIVQAPYIPRVVGYGVTDLETKQLASAKTLWPVGPISQGFTAVAIMQLYEKGKLDLQDKASKYVKGLPQSWEGITIRQLLQHSAGLPDYRLVKGFSVSKTSTVQELMASVAATPLLFAPGTQVSQSATNFLLLTSVVEKVSKMSYSAFVKKYQIDYLGLKQTFFAEDLPTVKQEKVKDNANKHKLFTMDKGYIAPAETTTGYTEQDNKLVVAPQIAAQALKGFSDIWASAENISHWDIALAGSVLIAKPENRALIYKATTLDNGKVVPAMGGWQFYQHKGLMDIKGTVAGHSGFLSRFTDASELVCVTLLSNKEGVDFTNLGRNIAATFDNQLGSGSNDNLLYTYESQFSVAETSDRLERELKSMNIPVFAVFDHEKNAKEVNLDLRPTRVIVFGSPQVGTKLMQENQSLANELPLKITIWEDEHGSVWTAFPQMKPMAQKYGMENHPIIGKMQQLLEKLTIHSSSVF